MKFVLPVFFIFIFSSCLLQAQQPRLVMPMGHASYVTNAVFSPDGKTIATISQDKVVKVWDRVTGKLLRDLVGHQQSVNSGQFGENGKTILTASEDGTAMIWDIFSGAPLFTFSGEEPLHVAIYDKRYERIFLATRSGGIKIYNASTYQLEKAFPNTGHFLNSLHVDSASEKMVAAFKDSVARIYDLESGKIIELRGHSNIIRQASFSPDGKKVVTASLDRSAKIWSAVDGELLINLSGHNDIVNTAEFSPDGNTVVTASEDVTAKVWNAHNGDVLFEIRKYAEVQFAHFSPDGKQIFTGLEDESACTWDAQTGEFLAEFRSDDNEPETACYSSDGNYILTTSLDKTALIWNAKSGRLHARLTGATSFVYGFAVSPDEKMLAAVNEHNDVQVWSMPSFELLYTLSGYGSTASAEYVHGLKFSEDGTKLFSYSKGGIYRAWNLRNKGKLVSEFPLANSGYKHVTGFSANGEKLIFRTYSAVAGIWSIPENRVIINMEDPEATIEMVVYNKDETLLVSRNTKGRIRIWDAYNGKEKWSIAGKGYKIRSASFLNNTESSVITICSDSTARLWRQGESEPVLVLTRHESLISGIRQSPSGNQIITQTFEGTARLWNVSDGKMIIEFPGDSIETMGFTPDPGVLEVYYKDKSLRLIDVNTFETRKVFQDTSSSLLSTAYLPVYNWMLASYGNGIKKIWDTRNGEWVARFFAVDSSDYFIQNPSGYYLCSRNASKKLHYVNAELNIITFEQLDIKYNRPDKIYEALDNKDTALIRSYRRAWEKRLKRLGIDSLQFRDNYSFPVADFENREAYSYEQDGESFRIEISASDSLFYLDRFNVWVNGSPLYGRKGISLKNRNLNIFDTSIHIRLSRGENRLETSVTNVNGTESYRVPLELLYDPGIKQKESILLLGIGIDRFRDEKYNLQYSSKDIVDLTAQLKEKYGDALTVHTLFNQHVTTANVHEFRNALLNTTENDKIILAFSGHGLLSKEFDYYLSTFSVDFDSPEKNGLPYELLEDLLDSIPARKKLILIDACHSGEVDKEELILINKVTDSLRLVKGLKPVAYRDSGKFGLENSFELMQNLFGSVGKNTGAIVISAAGGTQFALEKNNLENGVFTYSILEAMRSNAFKTISELKRIVIQRVVELTNGLQKPTSRNETLAVDWELW